MTALLLLIAFAVLAWIGLFLAWADMLRQVLWSLWAVWVVVWGVAAWSNQHDVALFWQCIAAGASVALAPIVFLAIAERRRRRHKWGMIYR